MIPLTVALRSFCATTSHMSKWGDAGAVVAHSPGSHRFTIIKNRWCISEASSDVTEAWLWFWWYPFNSPFEKYEWFRRSFSIMALKSGIGFQILHFLIVRQRTASFSYVCLYSIIHSHCYYSWSESLWTSFVGVPTHGTCKRFPEVKIEDIVWKQYLGQYIMSPSICYFTTLHNCPMKTLELFNSTLTPAKTL